MVKVDVCVCVVFLDDAMEWDNVWFYLAWPYDLLEDVSCCHLAIMLWTRRSGPRQIQQKSCAVSM